MSESTKAESDKPKSSKFAHYTQYLAVRSVSMLLGLFDIDVNLGNARAIGKALYKFDKRHRARALENLRSAFPEKDEKELDFIAERSMQHFIELVMDVLFLQREIHVETWHEHVHFVGLDNSLRMLLQQKGCIVLTGHYGNWEVLGYTLATMCFETYSIARPIDNPYIDDWLLGVREKQGQIILSKRGVTVTAQDVLAKRATLGFIADQNAGPKGMFVPFFNRLASTYKSIGLLAIQNDLAVIIGYARRRGGKFDFDIGVTDIIYPDDWKNLPKDAGVGPDGKPIDELYYVTARYTKAIETFVRQDPTQYLWIHRRWKTRPRWEEKAKK